MLALFVSLHVRAGSREVVLDAIRTQAALTREHERGCLRFDVTVDAKDPDHLLLYEVYADEAALDAHRATPNYARWREVSDRHVERRESTLATIV